MVTLRDFRRTLRKYAFQSLIVILVLYFLYHLIQGGRGIMTLKALENHLVIAKSDLHELKAQHNKLKNKVDHMKPGSVCPDLLEEQAKAVLGYKHHDEKIVLENK